MCRQWPPAFLPDCSTGLFFTNEKILPGILDVQSATYDNPDAVPARAHIQVADRISWMERALLCSSVIRDERGETWPDVSAWYWHAMLGSIPGPWWSFIVAERS